MKLRGSGRNLHGLLRVAAESLPDATAVTFLGDRAYSRAELYEMSLRVAAGLRAHGVRPGDRVAIFLGNRVEFLATFFAVSALGAVSVPLNNALRGDVLRHMFDSVSPCVLVAGSEFAEQLEPVLSDQAGVQSVWAVGSARTLSNSASFETLLEFEPLEEWLEPQPWELACILFTSGTTGPSKGVMWSHNLGICLAENATWVMGYTSQDVIYTCLPLFHINALFTAFYAGLLTGARLVVAPRFSASSFWRHMVENDVTVTNMLGSMGAILWRQSPTSDEKAHRVRLAMVVPFPASYVEEFEDRFHLRATELYGSTDTGVPLGIPYGSSRPSSCGIAAPGWECMLVDGDDEPVAPGELGELVTRPTRPFVGQLGYWGLPEKTLEAHANQWFHTGDAMRRDSGGWYYFADRKKDAIRVSGENVSSFEVEQVLLSHPAVQEAAVFAVPSELGEDDVMAALVLESGHHVDPEELCDFVAPRLPYFAVPRYLDFLAALPKTATEKVQKSTLRQAGVSSQTWDAGHRRRRGS